MELFNIKIQSHFKYDNVTILFMIYVTILFNIKQ